MSNSKRQQKKDQLEAKDDAKELHLLKQKMNEHKARKRRRGPYRKSYQPFSKES